MYRIRKWCVNMCFSRGPGHWPVVLLLLCVSQGSRGDDDDFLFGETPQTESIVGMTPSSYDSSLHSPSWRGLPPTPLPGDPDHVHDLTFKMPTSTEQHMSTQENSQVKLFYVMNDHSRVHKVLSGLKWTLHSSASESSQLKWQSLIRRHIVSPVECCSGAIVFICWWNSSYEAWCRQHNSPQKHARRSRCIEAVGTDDHVRGESKERERKGPCFSPGAVGYQRVSMHCVSAVTVPSSGAVLCSGVCTRTLLHL